MCRLEDAAVRAVPCALEGAWLPCVGVAFTGHPRPLPKTKYLPRYSSVKCHPNTQHTMLEHQSTHQSAKPATWNTWRETLETHWRDRKIALTVKGLTIHHENCTVNVLCSVIIVTNNQIKPVEGIASAGADSAV